MVGGYIKKQINYSVRATFNDITPQFSAKDFEECFNSGKILRISGLDVDVGSFGDGFTINASVTLNDFTFFPIDMSVTGTPIKAFVSSYLSGLFIIIYLDVAPSKVRLNVSGSFIIPNFPL